MSDSKPTVAAHVPHETLLESLFDGVYYVDRKRNIVYWNGGAERITGYDRNEVIGRSCGRGMIEHVDHDGMCKCDDGCPLMEVMQTGKPIDVEVFLHHKAGHRVPVSVRSSPVKDAEGNIIGAVEVFNETPHRVGLLSELQRLKKEVYVDALTGVGNRKFADLTLDTRFAELRENRVPFGILIYDIDHFKNVNDTHGHDVGDKILIMIARTITAGLRDMDVLCRWGGEEFMVFVPDATETSMRRIADRTLSLVRNAFLDVSGHRLAVTISAGATVARSGDTPASIIKRADDMLYKSKNNGRDQYHYA